MDFIIIDDNAEDDIAFKDESGFPKAEDEYPFTIVTVKIGDDGNIEETDAPVHSSDPQHENQHSQEQGEDSSETDNSEDWNDVLESPQSPADNIPAKPHPIQEKSQPFVCTFCNKEFNRRYNLDNHVRTHTGEKPFSCTLCDKTFHSKTNLNKHAKLFHPIFLKEQKALLKHWKTMNQIYPEKRVYPCPMCKKICMSQQSLAGHMSGHVRSASTKCFKCEECGAQFRLKQWFERHMEAHSAEGQLNSTDQQSRPKKLTFRTHLNRLQKDHTGNEPLSCSANETFLKASTLRFHFRPHKEARNPNLITSETTTLKSNETEPEELLKCEYCGVTFTDKLTLSYHERTHRIIRAFTCPVCNKGFNKKSAYDTHCKKHGLEPEEETEADKEPLTDPKRYKCSVCQRFFALRSIFVKHVEEHERTLKRTPSHKPSSSIFKFTCPVCPRTFSSQHSFRCHTYRYHNSKKLKPFACEECGARFEKEEWLDRHMEMHNEDRPYFCQICNKRFLKYTAHKIHMRTHTGERPFSCKFCKKRFKTSSNLHHHLKIHTGERPFSCPMCNRGFSRKASVRRHLKIHKKYETAQWQPIDLTNAYECDECGTRFKYKKSLLRHARNHTKKRYLLCRICEIKSDSKQEFKEHMRMHSCVVRLWRLNDDQK